MAKKKLTEILVAWNNKTPEQIAQEARQSLEKQVAIRYNTERKKSCYTGFYAHVLQACNNYIDAQKMFRARLDDLGKDLDVWTNKQYKTNNSHVTTFDVSGDSHVRTISYINESRRQRKIQNLKKEISEIGEFMECLKSRCYVAGIEKLTV